MFAGAVRISFYFDLKILVSRHLVVYLQEILLCFRRWSQAIWIKSDDDWFRVFDGRSGPEVGVTDVAFVTSPETLFTVMV